MVKESSSEAALQKFDEQFQKYRFMESNLLNKKIRSVSIYIIILFNLFILLIVFIL